MHFTMHIQLSLVFEYLYTEAFKLALRLHRGQHHMNPERDVV
jgi:hypothetical protein